MEKESLGEESCSACELGGQIVLKKRSGAKGHSRPDHSAAKKRINRIKGQLDAVSRMVDEKKYCLSIIQQIRAATSALRGLEAEVLKGHLRGCVKTAFESKDSYAVNDKIEEILRLWSK